MLLAFLIDQILQSACHIFRAIELKIKTKIKLWQSIKSVFHTVLVCSMEQIYRHIAMLFEVKLQ